ncbi:MAG: membrane protein insertase YidC [Patescibacteria group bacterium]|nr:membrane protein insertase YidC [Patescibacteria group bacterium]
MLTVLITPLYNLFVFLLSVVPGGSAGLAIIALTLLMRIVLYPLFASSIRTQMGMQAMQGEMDAVNKKYKDDTEALTRARIELMRRYKVRPLSAVFALIVQFGLLISLYWALFREGFPTINQTLLYSFVHAPSAVNTAFFGLNLLAPRDLLLAVLVAATQWAAIYLTLKRTNTGPVAPEQAQVRRLQSGFMLWSMPVLIGVISFSFPGAVGLYFVVTNLFSVLQEWIIRRHFKIQIN